MLITIWLAVTLAFFALRLLPGNAIEAQLSGSGQPPEVVAERKAAYGLDKPLVVQYVSFLARLMRGDLGKSLYGGQTVTEILIQRFPPTLTLAGLSMVIAILLGLLLGIGGGLEMAIASPFLRLITDLSFGVPVYWTGTVTLFVLGAWLGGVHGNVMLPVMVLGFHASGAIARVVQVNVRDAYHADFVRTARSKGLPERTVILRHVLRVGLIPVITIIALQSGILFSGTVITETIFLRPGIGQLLLDATLQRNYPVVQGVVIVVAVIYVIFNRFADIATRIFDPRIALS